jgi:hypothetical protein
MLGRELPDRTRMYLDPVDDGVYIYINIIRMT